MHDRPQASPYWQEADLDFLHELVLHEPVDVAEHGRVLVLTPAVVQLQEQDRRQAASTPLGDLAQRPAQAHIISGSRTQLAGSCGYLLLEAHGQVHFTHRCNTVTVVLESWGKLFV